MRDGSEPGIDAPSRAGPAVPRPGAAPDAAPVAPAAPGVRAQLTAHRARRVELPGPDGPLAALRVEASETLARDLGPPAVAVLVPGYSGSKEDFAPLLDPLADAGIGALALDLPGQYESPGPGREEEYHCAALGAVVARVVSDEVAAGRRVLLLGHSYGGLVARAAVLQRAPVLALTLMDSGPGELPMGPRRTFLDVVEPILRRRGLADLVASRDAAGDWSSTDPAVLDLLRRRLLSSSATGLLGMGHALRSEPDRVAELVAALRRRGLPCLVVCGVGDDAWPPAAQRTMADRLEGEFAAVAGAVHAPNVENPDGLLDVLVPTWRTWLMEDLLR